MLKNYIKIAVRNISKKKAFSIINVLGLSIGLAGCLLITLYVHDELSYDAHHENADNIYRVLLSDSLKSELSAYTQPPLGPKLVEDHEEVENMTRLYNLKQRKIGKDDGESISMLGFLVDPGYFDMFSNELISGNKNTLFENPSSMVLTQSAVDTYFNGEDPVGKTVTVFGEMQVEITGVVPDSPRNSFLQFDFLMPFINVTSEERLARWGQNFHYTFIQTQSNNDIEQLSDNIFGIIDRNDENETNLKVSLQALSDVHLNSDVGFNFEDTGDIKYVKVFIFAAFLILVIACINFMNMSTARATLRAKEVGLRKVIGATKRQLITQFLSESLLISFIAIVLAILLADLMLPYFSSLSGKLFTIDSILATFSTVQIVTALVSLLFFAMILSGGYPAFLLSSFVPIQVLKGAMKFNHKGFSMRKLLVVFQFTFSIGLIISALVITDQMNFIQNKSLGWEKDDLVYVPLQGELGKKYETYKNELLNNEAILNATAVSELPIDVGTGGTYEYDGMDKEKVHTIMYMNADIDFFETFRLESSTQYPIPEGLKGKKSYVINETALANMRQDWGDDASPIGKMLDGGTIVGVVKDFHFKPLREKIEGIVYGIDADDNYGRYGYLVVRGKPGNSEETINVLKNEFEQLGIDQEFDYSFVDETFNNKYKTEQRTATIINGFAILSIFISALGLISLASFSAEQRTKEIGIRKVLGATVAEIVMMMSKDFVILVLISMVVSTPIVYHFMDIWLSSFAYRVDLEIEMFVTAGIVVGLVSWGLVAFQSMHSAKTDPARTLRSE